MDRLEDAVTLQLKNVLEPAFGYGADQTEIMLTIGTAVAEAGRRMNDIDSSSPKTPVQGRDVE